MTMRLMPPASGPTTCPANGRSYTCAVGSTIDVPDCDAFVLLANGWNGAADSVGTTALRPTAPVRGHEYHDTTLGKNIRYDGKVWRDPATGSAV